MAAWKAPIRRMRGAAPLGTRAGARGRAHSIEIDAAGRDVGAARLRTGRRRNPCQPTRGRRRVSRGIRCEIECSLRGRSFHISPPQFDGSTPARPLDRAGLTARSIGWIGTISGMSLPRLSLAISVSRVSGCSEVRWPIPAIPVLCRCVERVDAEGDGVRYRRLVLVPANSDRHQAHGLHKDSDSTWFLAFLNLWCRFGAN